MFDCMLLSCHVCYYHVTNPVAMKDVFLIFIFMYSTVTITHTDNLLKNYNHQEPTYIDGPWEHCFYGVWKPTLKFHSPPLLLLFPLCITKTLTSNLLVYSSSTGWLHLSTATPYFPALI